MSIIGSNGYINGTKLCKLIHGQLRVELSCVVIFKKMDYHLWHGFVLLTIFSSYKPVIWTCRIIPFYSHKITVNPRT